MDLKPLYEPKAQKPLSQAIKGFRDGYTHIHPLLTTQGHTRIRANFTIADWLLMGSLFQAIAIVSTPLPVIYVLFPTFGLVIFKLTRLVLKIHGVVENPRVRNVRLGRQTALFPPKDGTMTRQPGEPVGGEGMCVVLLTNKCNQYFPFSLSLASFTDNTPVPSDSSTPPTAPSAPTPEPCTGTSKHTPTNTDSSATQTTTLTT